MDGTGEHEARLGVGGGKSTLLCLLPGQAYHLWGDGTLSCAQCLVDNFLPVCLAANPLRRTGPPLEHLEFSLYEMCEAI